MLVIRGVALHTAVVVSVPLGNMCRGYRRNGAALTYSSDVRCLRQCELMSLDTYVSLLCADPGGRAGGGAPLRGRATNLRLRAAAVPRYVLCLCVVLLFGTCVVPTQDIVAHSSSGQYLSVFAAVYLLGRTQLPANLLHSPMGDGSGLCSAVTSSNCLSVYALLMYWSISCSGIPLFHCRLRCGGRGARHAAGAAGPPVGHRCVSALYRQSGTAAAAAVR